MGFSWQNPTNPIQSLLAGQEFGKNLLSSPYQLKQMQLANALNEQKQKQQQMYLQKYPELLAAELAKAQAEPEEMRARSGLMGGQLREIEQKMKYAPELFSSESAERRAKAEDILRKNQLIQQVLSGGFSGGQQVPQGTSYGESSPLGNIQQRSPESQKQLPGGMTYAKAALISHLTGMPKPEIIDIDGEKIGVTAFGNVPIAKGLSPEEKAFQSSLGSEKGKSYSGLVGAYQGLANQSSAIDEMINLANNDPEFKNVTGPVGSFFTKWMGDKERRELLGRLQSSSGEIALQVAPSLKGAFTGRDQTLINQIKANPNSDFPDVFIGKLKSQKLINSVLQDRYERAANYMEEGMSSLKAIKKATEETPLEKYRTQINDMINPIKQTKLINGENYVLRSDGKVYKL